MACCESVFDEAVKYALDKIRNMEQIRAMKNT